MFTILNDAIFVNVFDKTFCKTLYVFLDDVLAIFLTGVTVEVFYYDL